MAGIIHAIKCCMESDEADDFLRSIRDRIASCTYHTKRRLLARYERWLRDNKLHLSIVTKSDIERLLLSMKSPFMRLDMLYVVKSLYDYLRQVPNPCEEIEIRQKNERRMIKVPSPTAIEEILKDLKRDNCPTAERNRVMVELAYGSGLRASELAALNVEDVDLQKQPALIHGKGGKIRVVPLPTPSTRLLQNHLEFIRASRGPMFTSKLTGRRLSTAHVSSIFKEKTGYNTHRFRHACASHLLQNGCSIRYIQELLGHERISTTDIYTHMEKGDLAKIVNAKHPRATKTHI